MFLLLAAVCVSAQSDTGTSEFDEQTASEDSKEPVRYEALIQYSQERLSRGLGTWRTAMFSFERRSGKRQVIWGTYRASERRSERDQEFIGGIYRRFGDKWAATAEGMYSPSFKYVGKFSVMGEVERDLGKGYVAHTGGRYTAYDGVKATSVYGLIEKYWSSNRVAYALYVTNLTNAGTAPTHRIQYNRYFGERSNTIGATFAFGREHENLGPGIGILRSETWSTGVSGRFWLTDRIGINVDGLLHKQGDLYYRGGLNFGTRIRF